MISTNAASARPCFSPRREGFSLMEILIVVALIGIILAYAVPTYRQYIHRAQRAEAVRTLLSIASCQERIRARSGFYDTTRCLEAIEQTHYAFSQLPEDHNPSLIFRAIATPVHVNSNDRCGTLTINQTGSRMISGDAQYRADCWSGR